MSATFSGEDIRIANAYSKSVQRAAIGEFVSRHDRVDYFPSYETVTLGSPPAMWRPDRRHVHDFVINAIMGRVLEAYVPSQGPNPLSGAVAVLNYHDDATVGDTQALLEVGDAQLAIGEAEAALVSFVRAAAGYCETDQAWQRIGTALDHLGYRLDAARAVRRALELNPGSHEGWNQLAGLSEP
jgi:hypothetical protein